MLKRLRDALASRDEVLAVIRGSAVVHGGRSNGLTAPNGVAEEEVMRRALRDGAVAPAEVSYVEAHATGTLLGDAVELEAIANVYGDRERTLHLGCVKTNLGHAEGAAGMAGVIKTVMATRRGAIPPTLHYTKPNPHADLTRGRCDVPATLTPWDGARMAGVSAFGMNGTNAHVVLAEGPSVVRNEHGDREELLVLSAKSRTALVALAKRYAAALDTVPLRDLCFTAAVGRTHFAHRLAIVANDADEMRAALDAFDAHYAQTVETEERVRVSRHELCDAVRAFLRGATIDCEELYREDDVRRVALPTYPFERKPYWIENGAAWREWIYAPEWVEIANARGAAESIVFEANDEPEAVQCARLLAQVREEAARETPRRLVIVTRGSSHGTTLRGLAAVIALEHPELRCKHVEVADDDAALSVECAADDEEQDVRLADGKRFARRLHRVAVPAEQRPHFRGDGTYVIAGGTGAIGRRIAQWLAERGAGRVVLLSRRGEPVDGFEVRRCDIADRDALRNALANLSNLRGVIHAAGVVSDRLLAHETEEHLAELFRAKVDGARNLHELTIDTPLDCFILFSSVTSLLGLTGAGAYAAANSALDALAQHRRDRDLPALSINWAAWRGLGMAEAGRDERRENAWRAHGIDSFVAEDGLAFLDAALVSPHAQLAFLPADWNAHVRHFRSGYVPPLLRDLVQSAQPRAATSDRGLPERLIEERTENGRRDMLLRFVNDSAARVIGRPHERLDPRRPLTELGVDSLGAIELRNLISIALDRTLPATLVYNHPTIDALARHLARITEAPRLPIRRAAAAAIEALTDDDAEALLEEAIDAWAEAKPRG